jgi:hypothetical protein
MESNENLKISHEFNSKNEWVGYEYIERISESHVRILKYDSSGSLQSSKHIFNDVPRGDGVQEFIAYMKSRKAIAHNNNVALQEEERNSRPIDTSLSLSNALLNREKR